MSDLQPLTNGIARGQSDGLDLHSPATEGHTGIGPSNARPKLRNYIKSLLPDPVFLFLFHHKQIGRYPRLKHPKTFNEMILQRNLRPDPRFAGLTDKLEVRKFVEEKVGDKHLIPLIAAPDEFNKEVFDALPRTFVMKANHGSSFVKLVYDKFETTYEELNDVAQQWLSTDFYPVQRERHYREIKPQIFFETLLADQAGKVPADFKLHCFRGRFGKPIIFILLISDRFGNDTHGDVYDVHWNRLDISIGAYTRSPAPCPAPSNLSEILRVATLLSEDFNYVRVDLYSHEEEVFFGELTFTPGAGVLPFGPDEIDYEWGRLYEASEQA
jgi:TupA-like ATPgrasp